MKNIMEAIKSLENRGTLLKGTTKKIISQDGVFLSFPKSLKTAGLKLMKSVLTPVAKRVLLLLSLSAGMSAVDAAIENNFLIGHNSINNFKLEYIMKIVKSCKESRLLIKGISENQLKMKQKNKKTIFFQCY